jgi:uncharacterized surface protein with fasciclin (FAS1) repeats
MKTSNYFLLSFCALSMIACNNEAVTDSAAPAETQEASQGGGQSTVQDNESAQNIVQVASKSKDHSTLVAAVKAAELVDALSNAGPFTVFAPVNQAFDKLPKGTVEDLLKPEKKDALQDILQYHVSLGVFQIDAFQDGQSIGQVNGGNIKLSVKDGKVMINDAATIVASIPTSNGIIHVIDQVLLPK